MAVYLGSDKVAGSLPHVARTRLYYNPSGTVGTVPLNASLDNFEKIRISYISNSEASGEVEVPVARGKFTLSIVDDNGAGTDAWLKMTDYRMEGMSIVVTGHLWRNINSAQSSTADNCIKIIEVIGISQNDVLIPSAVISPISTYLDANGWFVIDYHTHKEYLKNVDFTITINANAWSHASISNLPEGMSTLGNRFLSSAGKCGDAAIDFNVSCDTWDGHITINFRNHYSSALSNMSARVSLRIIEIPDML